MTRDNYFGSELFRFLRQLKRNNNREWFQANKSRYEKDVRDPMLRFITDFGPRLNRISTHFIADPRPIGGSLFRIHRDVRFSKDQRPYKTMAAAQFRHEDGKDVHAPGFYLHLEPANVFYGAGLWHPDNKTLAKIRDAIVDNPTRWKRILSAPAFRSNCTLRGESLKKPPRGYDPDHPFVGDLKRKDFVAMTAFSEEDVCSADFMNQFTLSCRRTAPFVEFLTRAVRLPFRN